ncbi:6-phosphogluconolactonase [Geobacter grbiciae]|uniref:6-phosphogluconolactonase n=1 Tax=Geobacter grbiciae TaxID=155042 RepID=UPI001C00FD25|nr:6-phosphogluconolactonase [Geobacter grbiciae]MBT1074437.1 6-phosphogluconolactonase [Geobacter grbiciae]
MVAVYTDVEALSKAAAELFAQESLRAVSSRGRFVVLLSGGETPRRTYQLLAAAPFKDQVPWPSVHVFWGDERYVSAGDPRSNARMVQQELVDHVLVPAAQVHPIPYGSSPRESAVVDERNLWVSEVYVKEEDLYRVTLTAPIINQGALVVFLVAGAAKAQILFKVLNGARDQRKIPAQLIKPLNGELLWLVDREAARLIRPDTAVNLPKGLGTESHER